MTINFVDMKLKILHEIVGKTRSGKLIPYTRRNSDFKELLTFFRTTFDHNDLLDAYATFDYLASKASRRKISETLFEDYSGKILRILGPDGFENAKKNANTLDAFALRKLALLCVRVEFR